MQCNLLAGYSQMLKFLPLGQLFFMQNGEITVCEGLKKPRHPFLSENVTVTDTDDLANNLAPISLRYCIMTIYHATLKSPTIIPTRKETQAKASSPHT